QRRANDVREGTRIRNELPSCALRILQTCLDRPERRQGANRPPDHLSPPRAGGVPPPRRSFLRQSKSPPDALALLCTLAGSRWPVDTMSRQELGSHSGPVRPNPCRVDSKTGQ